jgi:hypothetical protein
MVMDLPVKGEAARRERFRQGFDGRYEAGLKKSENPG